MEKVSHLFSVKEGDLVVSSGEGLVFPRGFALGKIETAQRDDLFFDVSVKPIIALHDIKYCTLLEKGAV